MLTFLVLAGGYWVFTAVYFWCLARISWQGLDWPENLRETQPLLAMGYVPPGLRAPPPNPFQVSIAGPSQGAASAARRPKPRAWMVPICTALFWTFALASALAISFWLLEGSGAGSSPWRTLERP